MTDAVAVSLIAAVGTVLVAMIQRLTSKVNGRLTELVALTKKSSHAEGVLQEKADESERERSE